MSALADLHFLRPLWLLALLALPLAAFALRRRQPAAGDWTRAIDPHLLPHLLDAGQPTRRDRGRWLAALGYVLAILALAGPSWRQVEQPLWQTRTPLVIAVDLSSAALAPDLPPTRLAQLRARLSQALQAHRGGQLALVAYAGDAFTVAPLTDDVANVQLFVDALQPDVMPVDGQAADRAIDWSRQLIERAGFHSGRIVLLTDHADAAAVRAAGRAQAAGVTVSALGVGNAAGTTVRTMSGAVVHVALDESSLRSLASAGGGRYARMRLDGGDAALFRADATTDAARGGAGGQTWADEGFRVLPALLIVALVLLLRRRAAVLLLAVVFVPWPSHAADLWRRPDQRMHAVIEHGVELYRRGEFNGAAREFARVDTADAQYDRGNALAKAGQLEEALAAYDAALKKNPSMEDAKANRRTVEDAIRRRPPQDAGQKPGSSGNEPKPCAPGQQGCVGPASPPKPNPDGRPQPAPNQSPNAPARPSQPQGSAAPRPMDPQQQARADAAQRERMQRALQAAGKPQGPQRDVRLTPAQRERHLADEAALKRVPDEPGSLLREKFRLEYERRQGGGGGP